MRPAISAAFSVLVSAAVGGPAHADDAVGNARDLKLFRLELDNDSSSTPTTHSRPVLAFRFIHRLLDEWPPGLDSWVGRVPGLGDEDPAPASCAGAWGITQLAITPRTSRLPARDRCLPRGRMLGSYVSWSSYDNERLAALQVYFGCMGSCSACRGSAEAYA